MRNTENAAKRRLSVESVEAGGLELLSGVRGADGSSFLLTVSGKPVAIPEIFIELAGELSGARAEGGTSAFKKEHSHEVALGRV